MAGFKRFFGFETYEDVPVPVPVVKAVGAFRSDVAGLVANELDWLQEASGALRSTITKQASRLNQELDRRRRQVELQRASQLKATKRIAAADALAAIVSDLAPGATMEGIANPATLPPQVWSNDRLQTAVPLPVGTLLQLAAVAARSRHIAMRRTCIERVSRGKPSPRRALIWGWDLGYVSRFLELYWPDLEETVTPRTGGMTRWDGVPPLNELGVIVEEALTPDSETATSDDLETFLAEPTILFLLLDPHQVGSTDSWLNERSMLGRHVRRFAGSVVVAQSLRSLLHSTEALAEGVLELRRMTYEAGLEPRAFLANDDSSSLTALLDALWIAPSVRTHRDEQQMLAALASRWFHPPIVAADLVRDWCRLASGASSNA